MVSIVVFKQSTPVLVTNIQLVDNLHYFSQQNSNPNYFPLKREEVPPFCRIFLSIGTTQPLCCPSGRKGKNKQKQTFWIKKKITSLSPSKRVAGRTTVKAFKETNVLNFITQCLKNKNGKYRDAWRKIISIYYIFWSFSGRFIKFY